MTMETPKTKIPGHRTAGHPTQPPVHSEAAPPSRAEIFSCDSRQEGEAKHPEKVNLQHQKKLKCLGFLSPHGQHSMTQSEFLPPASPWVAWKQRFPTGAGELRTQDAAEFDNPQLLVPHTTKNSCKAKACEIYGNLVVEDSLQSNSVFCFWARHVYEARLLLYVEHHPAQLLHSCSKYRQRRHMSLW